MQEQKIHRLIWLIAALIVAATVLFAWQRGESAEDSAAAAFAEECGGCHGDGGGVADATLLQTEEGRAGLIDLLLRGEMRGSPGAHPTYEHLSDDRIAATLNHLSDGTFEPADVEARR